MIQTWNLIYLTVMGIVKIIERVIPASELGGPIRIAELAGQQMEAGWMNLLYFMGLLSVNLGMLNLLPIPVLDGGHLVFLSLEAIRRRPLSDRTMEISQKVGICLLGTLMIFVFYNDILRSGQAMAGLLILAIETATGCGGVALTRGRQVRERLLAEYTIQPEITHSRRLLGSVAA